MSLRLLNEGYSVKSFASGQAALVYLGSGGTADIILLEWRLPVMNGLEVLRELRQRGAMTPVIFLTALSDDIYEEVALAGGAVDFIGKSRRLSILVRRIELIAEGTRTAVDRNQQQLPDVIRLGALELRFDVNRALWSGQTVDLTLTEFRLVARLALKPGEDVSFRKLYDLVHGKDFAAGRGAEGYRTNVRNFIKIIRKKFRDVAPDFDEVHNFAGFGYRWRGSLRRAGAGRVPPSGVRAVGKWPAAATAKSQAAAGQVAATARTTGKRRLAQGGRCCINGSIGLLLTCGDGQTRIHVPTRR